MILPQFVIFNFEKSSQLDTWYVVDDGVMGGLSQGNFIINDEGNGLFYGTVSLENNGGFSSIRHRFAKEDVSGYKKAVIRLKGDGKRYQFRVKSNSYDRHSYIQYFKTSGEWETVELDLNEMYASWRGMKLDMPSYPAQYANEISFLVSNKIAEDFQLEIDYIRFE